ncbi:MAG: hypothetical protein NUV74_13545 [Candidatus Brocadiaceae bacterium]|nr:hypothetical protein [Candidatus Brocadiaceae bacterium]
MLFVILILGAIGGLLVLIAGIVGGKPFVGLRLKEGDDLPTAAITGAVRVLRNHLVWSLFLFAAGGFFVLAAFIVYIIISL